jgi:hypothetical protein
MEVPQDTIFLLSEAGSLERVPRTDYDSETLLQTLIEKYPDLLAGEQMQPETPIRWLVVSREAGVPDGEGGADRWAVDHLLLDQFGRPTFVEVKRSSDTRIRREVVGQMLDYAANAQSYWPVDRIRSLAVARYGGSDGLQGALDRLLGEGTGDKFDQQVEAFWSQVHENLRSGKVRLLFVADELPRELRRVIEFLNEQMPAVEVLGVEVCQYVGRNLKALVPRLVGMTEAARQEKGTAGQAGKTDLRAFVASCDEGTGKFFKELVATAQDKHLVVNWGTKGFSIRVRRPGGSLQSLAYGFPPESKGRKFASLQVYLAELSSADGPENIRKRVLDAAPFSERGQYTLELLIEPRHLEAAARAMSVLWTVAEELASKPVA